MLAANGKIYTSLFEGVCEFCGEDLEKALLSVLPLSQDSCFTGKDKETIATCIACTRCMTATQSAFFRQVSKVGHIVFIMPATKAASERSFCHEEAEDLPEKYKAPKSPE